MEEVAQPVHVPCNCHGCGGNHHQRGKDCPRFANSYDGKCKEGNDALDFRAGDVTRSQMEERNPQDDPAKTDPRF